MKKQAWSITEEAFSASAVEQNGSRYLIANGYMGYRGTLEEFSAEQLVALNMAGLFDKNGDSWRESVNAPNPLYTCLYAENELLSPLAREPISHTQTLDFRHGIHRRETVFALSGANVTLCAERFASMAKEHVLAMRYTVSVDAPVTLTLLCGIDGRVWDIHGPHLTDAAARVENDVHYYTAKTIENGISLAVLSTITTNTPAESTTVSGAQKTQTVTVTPEKPLVLTNVSGIFWGDATPTVEEEDYDTLLAAHKAAWDAIWAASDVLIEGDEEAQLALRYSLYHLNAIAPRGRGVCGIPARGLSGQVYKGASFWDTEMFMLPFFSLTQPEVAARLSQYRVNTLAGARKKAAEYGYEGAFFAWESQESGEDACTHFNVTDIFTGRPQRTYFRDKQIHISADVVYGMWEYCNATGRTDILENGGLETIYECVRFLYSYAVYRPLRGRYELPDVVGPDEYHERVDNNAYTNKITHRAIEILLLAIDRLRTAAPAFLSEFEKTHDLSWVTEFYEKLYVPAPDENLLIEQFDRYYRLEDVRVPELKTRVIEPNEYWGGHGLASNTRVLKQADVVMMLSVFRHDYSTEIKRANWEFYEPYTEHGSSLSACAYAIVAASIGNPTWAYRYFMKTATVDLTGDTRQYLGTIYIGGTHPAANGGSWNTAIFGFGGVSYGEEEIDISPSLPAHWKSLSFSLVWRGVRLSVLATQNGVTVRADGDASDIRVTVYGKPYEL